MKKQGKIVITGNFNILHPGHIRLFIAAKKIADHLTVGLISDSLSGDAAFIEEPLRFEALQNNNLVDEVEIVTTSIEEFILSQKPDFVMKGKEHENEFNIELEILEKIGGKLIFGSGDTVFSSTELLLQELNNQSKRDSDYEIDYRKRHKIDKEALQRYVNDFKNCRVAVIGDLIIDEYISCQALGMSQEDPTICIKPLSEQKFIGGAGIVACHASSLGSKVHFITVTGDDDNKEFARKKLEENDVEHTLLIDYSRPTILKKRYRVERKTLLRVNDLKEDSISKSLQKRILASFESIASKVDLLIFSDFNYGCLPQDLVDQLAEIAKKNNIIMSADSQSSSQIGNIARYKSMNLITPTEKEARLSMRNNQAGLVVLLQDLFNESQSSNTILKLGADGVIVFSHEQGDFYTDNLSAYNNNPVDVAGAGDSLLVVSSLVLSLGASIWESSYLGSIAAAVQVGKVGNNPLKRNEIISLL